MRYLVATLLLITINTPVALACPEHEEQYDEQKALEERDKRFAQAAPQTLLTCSAYASLMAQILEHAGAKNHIHWWRDTSKRALEHALKADKNLSRETFEQELARMLELINHDLGNPGPLISHHMGRCEMLQTRRCR